MGKKLSEETKRKMSEARKRLYQEKPELLEAARSALLKAHEAHHPATEETKKKLSEAGKRRYADPSEHEKQSERMKVMWTDERKESVREERSKRWEDPEYRERVIAANTGRKRKQSTKSKISEAAKERWANPAFKEKMKSINKEAAKKRDTSGPNNGMYGRGHTKESRAKISEAAKKRVKENPEYIENLCKAFKEKLKDPEFKQKMMEHLNNISSPTSIEVSVESVLKQMGIKYIPQKIIGPYIVDFYLPNTKTVIECDGDYWHNLPHLKMRDQRKDRWLKKRGIKVIRIWEHDINADPYQAVITALSNEEAD
jgi:very-short-patch-repair endonuclease